jgi:hypothetical protein
MQDASLLPGTEASAASSPTRIQTQPMDRQAPRLRRPDRRQVLLERTCVDERLPAERAAVGGVDIGRKLDQLCREHDAQKWLCGGVSLR